MRLRRPKRGQGYASFGRIIAQGEGKDMRLLDASLFQGKAEDVRINQGYCEGHHHIAIPTSINETKLKQINK